MSIWHIAWQNVRHQARSYMAFFFSSTFAVWMFFLYASLLYHPEVEGPHFPDGVKTLLSGVEILVALFAVVFVFYAHSAFLKARLRELATLQLLGMMHRQLTRLLATELILMGSGAIGLGVGFGLAFLHLFLLTMSRVLRLDQPIPFHLSWEAVGLTLGAFVLIFVTIALLSRRMLRRSGIAQLFAAAAKPKEPPATSPWLVLLCLVTLVCAYGMVLTVEAERFARLFLPMMSALALGTYLLFTQGSVALVKWLKGRRAIYLRRTNLLTIAQLAYKVRDNARILFLIAMLSTISITVMGLFYNLYLSTAKEAERINPIHLTIAGSPAGMAPERVTAILREHGVQVVAQATIPAVGGGGLRFADLPANYAHQAVGWILPLSDMNRWLAALGRSPIALDRGDAALLMRQENRLMEELRRHGPMEAELEGSGRITVGTYLMDDPINQFSALVVTDEQFARLKGATALHLYRFADWQAAQPALLQIRSEILDRWPPAFASRPSIRGTGIFFHESLQAAGFFLFLATFVGVLFFLGSCNLLYFKLFNDLMEERPQFRSLGRVGILPREVRRVVSSQTLLLFFAPLLLAVFNAFMAVQMFGRMEATISWKPMAAIALLYVTLFTGYFLVTRRTYVRALLSQPLP